MINYYKVLGVGDFSSLDEIKTAYRKLSKKFHPDVNDGDKFFEERFKEIQIAYEILSDIHKRSIHDINLRNNYTSFHNSEIKKPETDSNSFSESKENKKQHPNQPNKDNDKTDLPKSKQNYTYVIFLAIICIVIVTIAITNSYTKSKRNEFNQPISSSSQTYLSPSTSDLFHEDETPNNTSRNLVKEFKEPTIKRSGYFFYRLD